MQDNLTVRVRPDPSIVPGDLPEMTDDECLARLAYAMKTGDEIGHLEEIARLIGRLAVTIE